MELDIKDSGKSLYSFISDNLRVELRSVTDHWLKSLGQEPNTHPFESGMTRLMKYSEHKSDPNIRIELNGVFNTTSDYFDDSTKRSEAKKNLRRDYNKAISDFFSKLGIEERANIGINISFAFWEISITVIFYADDEDMQRFLMKKNLGESKELFNDN